MPSRRAMLALPALLLGAGAGRAETPPAPRGRVILDVSGRIAPGPHGNPARFDLARLDSLPQTGFATRTPWLEGERRFAGVAGAALVQALGATGTEVVATALNDYRVTIPFADFRDAGLLLATRIDGNPMPVREKGPVWIMYPFDTDARLRSELFYSRSIWQLRALEFRG